MMRLNEAISILETCAQTPPAAMRGQDLRVVRETLLPRFLAMRDLLAKQVEFQGAPALTFEETDPEVTPATESALRTIDVLLAAEGKR